MVRGEYEPQLEEVRLNPGLTKTSKLKLSDSSVSTKDSTKTAPVTMKMDPKGFYLYWINQSKVVGALESGTSTAWMHHLNTA